MSGMTQMSRVEDRQASSRAASDTEEVRGEMMHEMAKAHYK